MTHPKVWSVMLVAILMVSYAMLSSADPATNPPPELWGEPVDGIQMSIVPVDRYGSSPQNPEFQIAFRNVSPTDRLLNLGTTSDGHGYADRVSLILWGYKGEARTLKLTGPAAVGGIAGPFPMHMRKFLVPLPAGQTRKMKVALSRCWCPSTNERRLQLPKGSYAILAQWEGSAITPAKSILPSSPSMNLLADAGKVKSNMLRFEILG